MYISAIAVDFGSTNSGCCRVCSHDSEGNLVFSNPEFIQNVGDYAKDNTWFYVEPSFLERLRTSYNSITDNDFRIESRILSNVERPNIIWGRESIKRFASKIIDENWREFKRFKMMLYKGFENYDNMDLSLNLVIKTYLRIIKIECLEIESKRLGRRVTSEEIMWGITIPSIWSDENKEVMTNIAHEVFTPQTRILSEPEGPLVYSLIMSDSQGKLNYKNGRTSFVIDCGGGTTDICLMKEVKQDNGSFRIEMVANSDGSAAGGNDIDNSFYNYFLRKISFGKKSDNGVSYDSLNDGELFKLLFEDYQLNVGDFIGFEDNWYKMKNTKEFNSKDCSFDIQSNYRKWLINNGHHEVADVIKEYLVDGCTFPKDEIVEKVFVPTFNKIIEKIREILDNNKNTQIDRIVFAGGMSCNYLLNTYLRETITSVLGNNYYDKFSGMGPLMAGGAIAAGTCYILLHKDAIIRLAKKNYYFDSMVDDPSGFLIDEYKRFGIDLKFGDISSMIDDEQKYIIRIQGKHLVLHPIAIKDKLIQNLVDDTLYTDDNQEIVSIDIYSSKDKFVVYSNMENPELLKETSIECECQPSTKYKLEVDFNEAQISNALHYLFTERDSGLIVSEGFINDVSKHI